MCDTCGCDHGGDALDVLHGHDHSHVHDHSHAADHSPAHEVHSHPGPVVERRTVRVETDVLAKNARLAAANREWFEQRNVLVFNLLSSPGAGKTTLLERTLRDLGAGWPWAVIEGDQQTDNDARRIAACGVPVVQINTGTMCHLDAQLIAGACRKLDPARGTMMMIENVGNLVCPALFDLGEAVRVVVASVTEGDDKPAKYPYMFETTHLVVLNKCDLLPHVQFDPERFEAGLHDVNADARVIRVSATRGDGLPAWYRWLADRRAAAAIDGPHGSERSLSWPRC